MWSWYIVAYICFNDSLHENVIVDSRDDYGRGGSSSQDILATLPFTMTYKVLIVMWEFYIGLIPDPLPPIIQLILIDCWGFSFVVIREVDIGLRPDHFLHINIVEYTLYTQGSIKKLFQGVYKEKLSKQTSRLCLISTSKSSLLLLSNISTTSSSNHTTTPLSKHATTSFSKHSTRPDSFVFILNFYSYHENSDVKGAVTSPRLRWGLILAYVGMRKWRIKNEEIHLEVPELRNRIITLMSV